jgi:peptidoglycan-associated lipoprotein
MKFKLSRVMMVLLVAVMSACSSTGDKQEGVVSIEDKGTSADGSAVSSGAAGSSDFSNNSLDDPNSPLAQRVIYFEYDSAEITMDGQDLLVQHAGFLVANPATHITLEGSTDERGSREYNIALGDYRALSVQRVLELNGVAPEQITVVSYGEEKPAAEGNSDAAWRLNRRVELLY